MYIPLSAKLFLCPEVFVAEEQILVKQQIEMEMRV
jgi:hypothetical protein